jgi:uncharacterized protein (DUF433 family)
MTAPIDIGTLIVSTPGTVGGRPRIAGTRIAVDHIARLWTQGYSAEDIVYSIYTHLGLDQVYAALAYYFANRDAIDTSIREENELYVRLAAEERVRRSKE